MQFYSHTRAASRARPLWISGGAAYLEISAHMSNIGHGAGLAFICNAAPTRSERNPYHHASYVFADGKMSRYESEANFVFFWFLPNPNHSLVANSACS